MAALVMIVGGVAYLVRPNPCQTLTDIVCKNDDNCKNRVDKALKKTVATQHTCSELVATFKGMQVGQRAPAQALGELRVRLGESPQKPNGDK